MMNFFENMPALLGIIVEVALKGTLLMAAAATVTFALRGATATLRHMLWSFTLVAMLAIPAFIVVLPRWQIGIFPTPDAQLTVPLANLSSLPPLDANQVFDAPARNLSNSPIAEAVSKGSSSAIQPQRQWSDSLMLLWLGGVVAGFITIAGGMLTLRRIARRAVALDNPEWHQLARTIALELGITRKVRLLRSTSAAMPATWGVANPIVLLPADANEWDDDRRKVVLLHELAHVKRSDCLTQLIAQVCCAVYWFHPGVWYTARRVRAERELACDEHVLGVGVNACDYAAHLLEIARVCRAPSSPALAVAMARPSQLEGRLRAILEERVASRWRTSRTARKVGLATLAVATLPLAAMRPWRDAATSSFEEPEIASASTSTSASASASTATALATMAAADTFRWRGTVDAGKWVEVLADYGDLRAEPSRDGFVHILAIRKVGDARAYRIAMDRKGGGVEFCVVRAAAGSDKPCRTTSGGDLANGLNGVRVDFVITVPAGVGVSAHSGRGNIAAENMKSYVWATSGHGDIAIETSDLAEASTRVGSISAEFRRRTWKQDLEFYTDDGDVTVVAPSDANMMIQMETGSGRIRSEFPGDEKPFGRGRRSVAMIGKRGGALTLRTGRGTVELKKGPAAVADVSDMSVNYADAPITSVDPKPNPNPDPAYDPNPNPNPNPQYDPDPNINPHVSDDVTDERVPMKIPAGLVDRFTDAAMRGWPDATAIARLRNIAATHVKLHGADLIQERSAWALTLVRNGEIVAPLKQALSNSDWRVRAYAAWALGETRDSDGTVALTSALNDAHWRVRMHAAAGLQRLGTAQTVAPLVKALADDYWQVRISAIDALAWIGDRRALPALQTVAQSDPRTMVREEAQSAIQRIK